MATKREQHKTCSIIHAYVSEHIRLPYHEIFLILHPMNDHKVGTHGSCVRNNNTSTHGSCVRNNDTSTHTSCVPDPKQFPQRKSPRAEFHNYSGGSYFVTICTRNRAHFFGEIHNGEMHLSHIGEYCKQELENVTVHYPYAEIPLYVVMPNHIHAIICIDGDSPASADSIRTHEPCVPTVRSALSVVVGGLKRAVTMYARRNNIEFGWQGRYHDHIIRGNRDGNMISEYIENNVVRWANDCFYK